MAERVLIVESSITSVKLNIIESALNMGLLPFFLCRSLEKYQKYDIIKFIEKGLEYLEIGAADTPEVINMLQKLNSNFNGIVCLTDSSIELAAELAEHFNLPFISAAAARICRNKDQISQLCQKLNILHPACVKVNSYSNIINSSKEIIPPCIIKPVIGTGSIGVDFCEDKELLNQKLKIALLNQNSQILLHEYIPGPVVSLECIIAKKHLYPLGLADRIMGQLPRFLEIGATFPVILPLVENKIIEIVSKIVDSLNIDTAVLHVEFILSNEGPVLIEVNPRLGGGLIGESISNAYGIDIYSEIIKIALNQAIAIPSLPKQAMTAYFLYANKQGKIKNISGINTARSMTNIKILQHAKTGDYVDGPPIDFRSDMIATIISVGENSVRSLMSCFAALSAINIEYH